MLILKWDPLITLNLFQYQDLLLLLLPQLLLQELKEWKVKKKSLKLKSSKISLILKLKWLTLDYHMPLLSSKLEKDIGHKKSQFQDLLLLLMALKAM